MFPGRGSIVLTILGILGIMPSAPAMELVAHRCGVDIAPENTLAAARRCIELGVSWVEIDVRQSRDGVFYLMHDPTVDRTTNGTGLLSELESTYIDTLDAGSWFDSHYEGERVPRLRDFLLAVRGKLKVFVDFKAGNVMNFVALVRELNAWHNMLFAFSFSRDARRFRELAPDWPLKVFAREPGDVERLVPVWRPVAVECYTLRELERVTPLCRAHGIKTVFFTSRSDAESLGAILAHGPDMLGVNNPETVCRYLSDKGINP
ncbi:MAG TPA: glycerophosphodiester phosphodiesterase family protein [Candidatus Hydrogenedentes bacterium]|nr:glycerophosphodiester phosphodiesterase family protein [Candidatus Hydrogenedentota bacterium]HOK89875.1 glycerophosphodiester phosphodiesterase family protein [Candidatus Hydrogenedentota bacterium]